MAPWYDLLLGAPVPEGVTPRDAKRALARALVARFAGSDAAAAAAEDHFDRVHVRHEVPDDIPELAVPAGGGPGSADGDGVVHLPAVLAEAFGVSRSDARRTLAQGGVRLDGDPLGAEDVDLAVERLDGHVLQMGKRRFVRIRVASA